MRRAPRSGLSSSWLLRPDEVLPSSSLREGIIMLRSPSMDRFLVIEMAPEADFASPDRLNEDASLPLSLSPGVFEDDTR